MAACTSARGVTTCSIVFRSARGRGAKLPQRRDGDEEAGRCNGDVQAQPTPLSLDRRRGVAPRDTGTARTHSGTHTHTWLTARLRGLGQFGQQTVDANCGDLH